jgi:hypothetical protein
VRIGHGGKGNPSDVGRDVVLGRELTIPGVGHVGIHDGLQVGGGEERGELRQQPLERRPVQIHEMPMLTSHR